jgi:hypothetical protein
MANPQQPPDPNAKKSIVFALAPFGAWFVIVLIALAQNKGFDKLASLQKANASTDIRSELKECYAKLKLAARGIDEASVKEVNDRLFECREELKNRS